MATPRKKKNNGFSATRKRLAKKAYAGPRTKPKAPSRKPPKLKKPSRKRK